MSERDLEEFGDGPASRLAGLDPRVRLVGALGFAVVTASLRGAGACALALALGVLLVVLADMPLRAVLRRLLRVEAFLVVLLVMLPLTMEGPSLATLGPLAMSSSGLQRAMVIALTVNACLLAITALLGGLGVVGLGRALAGLRAPGGLVRLLTLSMRYVAVFRAETARLREAMRARGFAPRADRHSWRSFGNLVGMMLVRSLERAERVEDAMRCRGFTGSSPAAERVPLAARDHGFAAALALLALLLVTLDRLA